MQNKFQKLQTLTLKGFKSIRRIDALAFEDINIILGPNGAGKSNFVGFFPFIARLAREELQDYVAKQGGLDKLLFFGPKTTSGLEVGFRSDRNEYAATLEPTVEGGLVFTNEACGYMGSKRRIVVPQQSETQLRRTRRAGAIPPFVYEPIENWRTAGIPGRPRHHLRRSLRVRRAHCRRERGRALGAHPSDPGCAGQSRPLRPAPRVRGASPEGL